MDTINWYTILERCLFNNTSQLLSDVLNNNDEIVKCIIKLTKLGTSFCLRRTPSVKYVNIVISLTLRSWCRKIKNLRFYKYYSLNKFWQTRENIINNKITKGYLNILRLLEFRNFFYIFLIVVVIL